MNARKLISEEFRFLTFRSPRESIAAQSHSFLKLGLLCTWLAGIGRYWDNPRADFWQILGLGSVIYVFVLAFILWIIVLPLNPKHWTYRNVLIFVTMTSPLAFLYAIPVEKFMSVRDAGAANAWFLAVVAIWRVALLFRFLKKVGQLRIGPVIVATLLPLTLIVTSLTALNLEHAVFEFMAGIQEHTSYDNAYIVVLLLTICSFYAAPILLIAYGAYCWLAHLQRNVEKGC